MAISLRRANAASRIVLATSSRAAISRKMATPHDAYFSVSRESKSGLTVSRSSRIWETPSRPITALVMPSNSLGSFSVIQ